MTILKTIKSSKTIRLVVGKPYVSHQDVKVRILFFGDAYARHVNMGSTGNELPVYVTWLSFFHYLVRVLSYLRLTVHDIHDGKRILGYVFHRC